MFISCPGMSIVHFHPHDDMLLKGNGPYMKVLLTRTENYLHIRSGFPERVKLFATLKLILLVV